MTNPNCLTVHFSDNISINVGSTPNSNNMGNEKFKNITENVVTLLILLLISPETHIEITKVAIIRATNGMEI